jgi:hypothetical protein
MQRSRLPEVLQNCKPSGSRNWGRRVKRMLDEWGWTVSARRPNSLAARWWWWWCVDTGTGNVAFHWRRVLWWWECMCMGGVACHSLDTAIIHLLWSHCMCRRVRLRDLVHAHAATRRMLWTAVRACVRAQDRSWCRQQVSVILSESNNYCLLDDTPYNPAEKYQRCRVASCLHLEVHIIIVSFLLNKSLSNWQTKHRMVWCDRTRFESRRRHLLLFFPIVSYRYLGPNASCNFTQAKTATFNMITYVQFMISDT